VEAGWGGDGGVEPRRTGSSASDQEALTRVTSAVTRAAVERRTEEEEDEEEEREKRRQEEKAAEDHQAQVKERASQAEVVFSVAESQITLTSSIVTHFKTAWTEEVHERDLGILDWSPEAAERAEMIKWREYIYTPNACYFFAITNPVRWRCFELIEWRWFDRFILMMIAANCLTMTLDEPLQLDLNSDQKRRFYIVGAIFQMFFLCECLVKVTAMGFINGPKTYLRDGWNCLDFFIVVIGMVDILELSEDSGSMNILRTFRLLRPLRALRAAGRFKNIRMLVELLIACMPMLSSVFGLISFIFFIFGILGVQLWGGVLRSRCYSLDDGEIDYGNVGRICSLTSAATVNSAGGMYKCNIGYECLPNYLNPYYHIVHFDNIGGAMMIIFQTMVQEDWSIIMYKVWDAFSFWTWSYFVVLNVVGPMFAIQLFLVVVANKYAHAKEQQRVAEESAVCLYEVKIGIIAGVFVEDSSNSTSIDSYCKVDVDGKFKKTRISRGTYAPEWHEYFVFKVPESTTMASIQLLSWQRYGPHPVLGTLDLPVGKLDDNEEGTDKLYEVMNDVGNAMDGNIRIRTQWRKTEAEEWSVLPEVDEDEFPEEDDLDEEEDLTCFGTFRFWLLVIADSEDLNNLVTLMILINVAFMAVDHDCDLDLDEYCMGFKANLEVGNAVFTLFFLCELVIKVTGFGVLNYAKEPFNLLDAFIVTTSMLELPAGFQYTACLRDAIEREVSGKNLCVSQSGIFLVLRSFRLVRILRIAKLVRAFPQIQKQIKVISKTIGAVSSLVALILLFMIIFAILGMSLLGGKSMEALGAHDVDSIPLLRKGAYIRVIRPGDPRMQTAQIRSIDFSREASFEIEHFMDQGVYEWVWDMQDTEPEHFLEIAGPKDSPELGILNATRVVGLAPRDSFDTFMFSCLTVFQLLTASDIGDVMYPSMRGAGTAVVIYFIILTVIGNFMLFNLFVAIIITGFSETKAAILKEEREQLLVVEEEKLRRSASVARGASISSRKSHQSMSRGKSLGKGVSSLAATRVNGFWDKIRRRIKGFFGIIEGEPMTVDQFKENAGLDGENKSAGQSDTGSVMEAPNWRELPYLRMVIENRYFTGFIVTIILVSCVPLAMDYPGADPAISQILAYVTYGTNGIFIIECGWKIAAYGWKKYITSKWNRLDFFLVVTSILDMLVEIIDVDGTASGSIGFLKTFRIFRALRPLRVISKSKGLKVVLQTVARAIVPVMNTILIALSVFFVFGIMAVTLLGGRTSYCTDVAVEAKANCSGVDESLGEVRTWRERQLTYGNIGSAMLSMFVLASQDNWEMHMYAGVDATASERGPVANSDPVTAIWFISFMIVGSFFVIQLFVGVFIDTFQTVTYESKSLSRNNSNVSSGTTDTEMKNIVSPSSPYRLAVFTVVTQKRFDILIAVFIVSNVVTMSAETFQASEQHRNMLAVFDFLFNFVFAAEVVAKLFALYPQQYFISSWNRFDFIVVMVSFSGILIDHLGSAIDLNPTILRVLRIVRIFRILRAFRIFKAAQGLQNLVRTLTRSLGAVTNLGTLLILLFFVAGVFCVDFYSGLCLDDWDSDHGPSPYGIYPDGRMDRCVLIPERDLLEHHASFSNLGMALLTLFRICTADNWSEIMAACSLRAGPRVFDGNATQMAMESLRRFNATGDVRDIHTARSILPGCQSATEINALDEIISCAIRDPLTGLCPSNCGNMEVSSLLFSMFLCASNFVLLNLVMAVLMQELQASMDAVVKSETKKKSLSVLLSVSSATSKWLKLAGDDYVETPQPPLTPGKAPLQPAASPKTGSSPVSAAGKGGQK